MRSHWTPLAIILAAFIIVFGAYFVGQSVWLALTAIGTIGVVVWAVFHQFILSWLSRPNLEVSQFELEPPFFRPATEHDQYGTPVATGYYISIQINNIGKTSAEKCQAVVTAIGRYDNGEWEKEPNWIPTGLLWTYADTEGEQHHEKNLVPERPYFFSLGNLTTQYPEQFMLRSTYETTGQHFQYLPGEYCFEVTVFGEMVKPIVTYFRVRWDGGCTDNFEEVSDRIRIVTASRPPW